MVHKAVLPVGLPVAVQALLLGLPWMGSVGDIKGDVLLLHPVFHECFGDQGKENGKLAEACLVADGYAHIGTCRLML